MDSPDRRFRKFNCNLESVDLEPVTGKDEAALIELIEQHSAFTGSLLAQQILAQWKTLQNRFVKVMPTEYRKALARMEAQEG